MNYGELKAKMDAYKSSVPAFVPDGTADGGMSLPKVTEDAQVEIWTVLCTTLGGTGVAKFSVTGSESGLQDNVATSNWMYTSDNGEVSFLITAGATPFAADDVFTFAVSDNVVGMNDEAEIRDINFVIHSKVDDVKVGYDAGKDQVCVLQID